RLIAATDTEELIPAMDIHALPLKEIVRAVRHTGDSGLAASPQWSQAVDALARRIDDQLDNAIGDQTLGEFIAEAEPS
ncbi:MAG: hypothetical protein AAGJ86_06030, partial [Pseudomonadota bacterium]